MTHKHPWRWSLFALLLLAVFGMSENVKASLVEIYINDSEELTESEEEFIIRSGKDLDLEIRLSGAYRIDSEDADLSVESIYINIYFDSDEDRRDPTSGIPQFKDHEGLDPGYDLFVTAFKGDNTRFEGYEGPIRFSIIMKNSSSEIVRDSVIIITMEAPPSKSEDSSGFSFSIPEPIMDNLSVILGGIVGLFILSFGIYRFILSPEDTTADIYRTKENIEPLKKSLTGVGYESELPSEQKENIMDSEKFPEVEESSMEKLEKLIERRNVGEITSEEFDQMKKEIMEKKPQVSKDPVEIAQEEVHTDDVPKKENKDGVVIKSNIGASDDDKFAKLDRLAEIKEKGLIDDDEFKQMKKEILGK